MSISARPSRSVTPRPPLPLTVSRAVPVCADVLCAAVPELALGLWRLDSLDVGASWQHKETVLVPVIAAVTHYASGTTERLPLLLKADPQKGGWHADQVSRSMRAAGLDGRSTAIMRTYGVDSSGTLVSENVAGHIWDTLLRGPLALPCARQVARFLVRLQSSEATLPAGPELLVETTRELTELAQLAGNDTVVRRQVRRLAAYLVPALNPTVPLPLVPAHGDLHPRNVIFDLASPAAAMSLTAIDLDHVGLYEPALDVGYAVAHLIVRARRADINPRRSLRLGARLWDEYCAAGGSASEERVAVQTARALAQVLHYELIGMGGGRPDSLPVWSTLALRLLERGRAALGPPR